LDLRSRTKNPTPSVARNPTPPKKTRTPYNSATLRVTLVYLRNIYHIRKNSYLASLVFQKQTITELSAILITF